MSNSNDMDRAIASNKNYLTSALVTLVAYAVFWLPGLILNIIYLRDARRSQQILGETPSGVGCLYLLLIVNVAWIVGLILLVTSAGMLAVARQ